MKPMLTETTKFVEEDGDVSFFLSPAPDVDTMRIVLSKENYVLLAGGFEPEKEEENIVLYMGSVFKGNCEIAHRNLLGMIRQRITDIIDKNMDVIAPGFPIQAVKFYCDFRYLNEATVHPTALGSHRL